ncbi:MAG: hypothetical protein F6J97_09140 [Leptolyngbya sp. SIO4C1]|nr:hypothetical protein [Leptolyngbya sp. SIO4C1]
MSTHFQSDDILEGARSIRCHLPALLGDRAEAVDQEIARLLAQAQQGTAVDEPLLTLLKQQEATYFWIAEYLSPQPAAKGFEPLPGRGGAIAATKYVCPQGDYVWYQRTAGQSPPRCPTHGELILAAEA